jgi:hypothetical protein
LHRPFVARRHQAGAVDRRIAAGGLSLTTIVLLGTVAFSRAPLPEVRVRDPAAARDLVTLMRVGERGGWIATYNFTRTLADGKVLRQRVAEGRAGGLHVVISGTSMTIEQGDRSYTCANTGGRSGCLKSDGGTGLPFSEVLRVAVATGAYDVVRQPDKTIAGVRGRCFRVRATGSGGLPDLGVQTAWCMSADGIPLQSVLVRPPGIVDEQVATRVRRHVTPDDVDRLARSFAPESP